MRKSQIYPFILSATLLALTACSTTGETTKISDDPTTQAISETYIEEELDESGKLVSREGGDDIIVTTSARVSASTTPSDIPASTPPPPAPVVALAEPSPSADFMDRDASVSSSPIVSPIESSKLSLPEGILSRSGPTPQAGLLTAGDYDDVLNPELYKHYVDKMLQGELRHKELPYVDADQRINIRVLDRLGKPMPMAELSLTYSDGEKMFPLRTGADGMAYLYPNYDALKPGIVIRVEAEGATAVTTTLSEDHVKSGGEIVIDLNTDRQAIEALDLLLTIDATGSMADEMRYLQKELQSILGRVEAANAGIDIRTGLIVYRDKGDAYVVKTIPFTDDIDDFRKSLGEQTADGGGDMPEAMQLAMRKGLSMDWREDALKINLLVADAPPHDEDISDTWKTGLISRTEAIHIVPIAASGVDKTAEFLMRSMAQITGGRFLFLTDDSGIGNPHAEPTVDCYVVTRLDNLVTRVLNNLITGERDEPEADDVIRSVGNYRAGVCAVETKAQTVSVEDEG